jgi:NADP-dependent aldehyde dehydrogenase
LFDAAASRPEPIPVYAEMGSLNPVILLPGALAERAQSIGESFVGSVTLGVGQFCTKPGLVFGLSSAGLEAFEDAAGIAAKAAPPATMLNPPMLKNYNRGLEKLKGTDGVTELGQSSADADERKSQAKATIFSASSSAFDTNEHLHDENFGPSALVVRCKTRDELVRQVEKLEGHLSASVHGTDADLEEYADVITTLERKVGRIVFNGYTTGIDLCAAMVHGGPYPATTHPSYSSMGHTAYRRFTRPVCYQGFPNSALPAALRSENALGIWRTVNGTLSKETAS